MRFFVILSFVGFLSAAQADSSRSNSEDTFERNENVRCGLSQEVRVSKEGGGRATPVDHVYPKSGRMMLFSDVQPMRNADSDIESYSFDFEERGVAFYYYMNTKHGFMMIRDKRMGATADSILDIADLEKRQDSTGVGSLELETDKAITVVDSNGREGKGNINIALRGHCWLEK